MRNAGTSHDTDGQILMSDDSLKEMACQELVEVITDYLEGTLLEPDRARFEAHLLSCPACHEYLEQMRALIRLSRGLTARSLDAATVDLLLHAFRDWRESQTGM
jgi:anti-sigma factor RsiW